MLKLLIKSIIATVIACVVWYPILVLIFIIITYILFPLYYFEILSKNTIEYNVGIISLFASWILSFWLSVKFTDLLDIGE